MDYLDIRELYHSQIIDNEMYHFGIKGQKWGIRRYQNPDGSLTPEGKEHYGKKYDSMQNYAMKAEQSIALANYGNLTKGRKHTDDDKISEVIRNNSIDYYNKASKLFDELKEVDYLKKVMNSNISSLDEYMGEIEKQAAKKWIEINGDMKISDIDPNGSIDYEEAIYLFTKQYIH